MRLHQGMATLSRARAHVVILSALICVVVGSRNVVAQHPVAMVHGINADGSTWAQDADLLRQAGFQVITPTLMQQDHLTIQAGRLLTAMNASGFGSNTAAIAHSQGGLIARRASMSSPLSAIMTVGTPHDGAPVASPESQQYFRDYLENVSYDLGGFLVIELWLGDCFPVAPEIQATDWQCIAEDFALAWSIGYAINRGASALANNFLGSADALHDLTPGSSFLDTLNSAASLQQQASNVPTRLAFKVELDGGYYGGPLRLVMGGEDADELGFEIAEAGDELEWNALDHIMSVDWDAPYAGALVLAFLSEADLGVLAQVLPNVWCNTISFNWNCTPSDAIVPTDRQSYPFPSSPDVLIVGPAHNQETSDPQVYVAFQNALTSLP
jgi:pimeloyl-ACP methyl ester carboxylesterase